ncbi:hypothetical protein K456DRAFT_30138 [Colletotrichum gloeosporioides 23]|nr:hypothetical protein K456DRAFT_30138 [Colletotrichum gloeosporioides 23]
MQMWLVVVCCRSCRRLLLLLLRCLRRMTAEQKSKYCYLGGSENHVPCGSVVVARGKVRRSRRGASEVQEGLPKTPVSEQGLKTWAGWGIHKVARGGIHSAAAAGSETWSVVEGPVVLFEVWDWERGHGGPQKP